jgi:hypothetical protein
MPALLNTEIGKVVIAAVVSAALRAVNERTEFLKLKETLGFANKIIQAPSSKEVKKIVDEVSKTLNKVELNQDQSLVISVFRTVVPPIMIKGLGLGVRITTFPVRFFCTKMFPGETKIPLVIWYYALETVLTTGAVVVCANYLSSKIVKLHARDITFQSQKNMMQLLEKPSTVITE